MYTSAKFHGEKHVSDTGKNKDKHKSKGYNKDYIKKKYLKKKKAEEQAFLSSLSDIELLDDEQASSSDEDEVEKKKIEDKFNGLCFFTSPEHGGFCTMAIEDEEHGGTGDAQEDSTSTEVPSSIESLSTELESMGDALVC